jgi:hypothetical protein
MTEIVKCIMLLVVIVWFCFECYTVYRITKQANDKLYTGEATHVQKIVNKNTATLKIDLINEYKASVKIKAQFYTNLRWWRQEIPTAGNSIYYYILPNSTKDMDDYTLAFGISQNKPCTKTKRFADLYYYYSVNIFRLFSVILLSLFALFLLFNRGNYHDVILIFSTSYLFLRMLLTSFLF